MADADDFLESLGAGICPLCGRAGYLLARIPLEVQLRRLVTITPSPDISWCDGVVTGTSEEFHEVWGHTTPQRGP